MQYKGLVGEFNGVVEVVNSGAYVYGKNDKVNNHLKDNTAVQAHLSVVYHNPKKSHILMKLSVQKLPLKKG